MIPGKTITRTLGVLALAALLAAGCGSESKEKRSDEDFRVPDSLLAPLEGFDITVDEYHPVRGGVLANKDIELHYPPSGIAEYISTNTFTYAYNAYREVEKTIGRPAGGPVYIIGSKDMDEYKFLTRKDWWYYGVVQGDSLYMEPLNVMIKRYDPLTKRTLLEIGLVQKLAQMALERMSGGGIPIWLKESLASFVAGEKDLLAVQAVEFEKDFLGFEPGVDEIEGYLEAAEERAPTRISFFLSYLMLENLMRSYTLDEILDFVRKLGDGRTLDQASGEIFGKDYSDLMEEVRVKNDFTAYLRNVPRPSPRN